MLPVVFGNPPGKAIRPSGPTKKWKSTSWSSQALETSFLPVAGEERGRTGPPSTRFDLSPSSCGASGDLVEGRVGNLIDLHLRNSLNHFRQCLLHFWIGGAAVR